ncbi:MAG: tetratricopeptide repeat protein [Candidatus Eiseniibacteriota bacterium]
MSDSSRDPPDAERTRASCDRTMASPTIPGRDSESSAPRIAGYEILGTLGVGGMGIVYEAEQRTPRRRVALKVIRGGQFVDEMRVRMFEREADTLARLEHPDIGAIYEAGRTDDGRHFFAMELVRGKTLGAYLQERTSPRGLDGAGIRTRLALLRRIADAVHYAHQRGVIHRDLKPSNIIVTEEAAVGAEGRATVPPVKILDFGLARITDTDVQASLVSEVGVIKGTLAYMSPEQARGDARYIDVRTDVYSLGVILYEMLSGRLPRSIPSDSMLQALRAVTEQPPQRLREAFRGRRRLDPDVETICHKALELRPEDRYGSAAALSDDVARYLEDQPIQARPPSTVYQLRKLVARNKLAAAFAATVALLLVGLAVAMSVLRGSAEHAREEAQARAEELELVTEFQASMLSGIDAAEMGGALMTDVRERIRESLDAEGVPAAEAESAIGAFDGMLARANATDVALRLVDEQVLGRAVEAIASEFAEQPLVRAALQQTVSDTYREIGLYPQALPLQEEALATYRRSLGEDHAKTLESTSRMGTLFWAMGRLEEALERISTALEGQRRVLGDDHPETLSSRANVASLLSAMGRTDEALAHLREALDGFRRTVGDDDAQTLAVINNMGSLLWSMGRSDEALASLREALEGHRRLLGEDDPATLASLSNIGTLLSSLSRDEEALGYLREAMERRRQVLGNDHPETLASINSVAVALHALGKLDEALVYDREALDGRRRVLGDDHPRTLNSVGNMGVVLEAMGRLDEALMYYRDALEGRRRVLGDDHPETLISICYVGSVLLGRDEPEKAAALLVPGESAARRAFTGDKQRRLGTYLTLLGRARAATGSFEAAQGNLGEAHAILAKAPGASRAERERVLQGLVALHEAWHAAVPAGGHDREAAAWRAELLKLSP